MAVRGTEEKQIITEKILNMFEGSIVSGKEIRIPIGEVEIKVALTCAKDCIRGGQPDVTSTFENGLNNTSIPAESLTPPSAEEVEDVKSLLEALNFQEKKNESFTKVFRMAERFRALVL